MRLYLCTGKSFISIKLSHLFLFWINNLASCMINNSYKLHFNQAFRLWTFEQFCHFLPCHVLKNSNCCNILQKNSSKCNVIFDGIFTLYYKTIKLGTEIHKYYILQNMNALSFYLTKTVLVSPKWFWSYQIDLDLKIMIWSRPK